MRRPNNANNYYAQQERAVAVLPEVQDVTALVVRGTVHFAKKHKVITGSYLLGVIVLLFFSAGIPLSRQQQAEYHKIMDSIDLNAEYAASRDYWEAHNAYRATKGWFFSCDGLCQRNKERMKRSQAHLEAIRAESAARVSDAKHAAGGIFSELGVSETKEYFWQMFDSGKQFAKRQSMWDMMFIGIRQIHRGRDETFMEYALKVLIQVLINFSMGLIMALIFFIGGLWSIIRSYQANPLTAVAYFVCAACAAFSFVASYLLAVYGAAATSVYGVLKLAETSSRAQRIGQGQQQRYVGYTAGDRPHYD